MVNFIISAYPRGRLTSILTTSLYIESIRITLLSRQRMCSHRHHKTTGFAELHWTKGDFNYPQWKNIDTTSSIQVCIALAESGTTANLCIKIITHTPQVNTTHCSLPKSVISVVVIQRNSFNSGAPFYALRMFQLISVKIHRRCAPNKSRVVLP